MLQSWHVKAACGCRHASAQATGNTHEACYYSRHFRHLSALPSRMLEPHRRHCLCSSCFALLMCDTTGSSLKYSWRDEPLIQGLIFCYLTLDFLGLFSFESVATLDLIKSSSFSWSFLSI